MLNINIPIDGGLSSPTGSVEDYPEEIPFQSGYARNVWTDSQSNEFPDLNRIASEDLLSFAGEVQIPLSDLMDPAPRNGVYQAIHQVLPDLEEHDFGEMEFEIKPSPQQKGKINWLYSNINKKVYIKLNEIANIEVSLKQRQFEETLYLRIMLVFNSEFSEPVIRCENHSSKDPTMEKNIKHSVLRCENQNVTYEGSVTGKNISDRLAVRIPLGCVKANEEKLIKQTVALKFVCQNSCVGRRETSIIFYLENANGEILAKKIIGVKICSCPKRDMNKEEGPKKRTKANDECPMGKKILKTDREIKEELDQDDEDDTSSHTPEGNDICITPNGVKLTMDLPDLEAARHVAECAYNKVAAELHLDRRNPQLHSKFCALKDMLVKLKQLNEHQMN